MSLRTPPLQTECNSTAEKQLKLKTKCTLQNIAIRSFHRVTLRQEEFKKGRTGPLKSASSAYQCGSAPRGAFRGRASPPSEDCAPKKLTRSGLLECKSRPKTPKMVLIVLEFASKNCFFVVFVDSRYFMKHWGRKPFFFWSSL